MYMTGSMRTTLAGRLKAVEEARGRVERDIDRNKSLDAAVEAMARCLSRRKPRKPTTSGLSCCVGFQNLMTTSV